MKYPSFRQIRRFWQSWLERRRKAELEQIQERLAQEQWRNSLVNRAHDADLSAGYNLNHFNTMQ